MRSMIIATLLVGACGCVVTKPDNHLTSETEFDAWVVARSVDSISIRCELRRPIGIEVSDLWRRDTLEVQGGTNTLLYTIEGGSRDMLRTESMSSKERFGFGILPFGVDRKGQRTSVVSQVLIRVEKTEGLTALFLVYHGTNAFASCPQFTKGIKIR